jgi:hypothetical protein
VNNLGLLYRTATALKAVAILWYGSLFGPRSIGLEVWQIEWGKRVVAPRPHQFLLFKFGSDQKIRAEIGIQGITIAGIEMATARSNPTDNFLLRI